MGRRHTEAKGVLALIAAMLCVTGLGFAAYSLNGLTKWRFDDAQIIEDLTTLSQDEFAVWTNPGKSPPCFQLNEPWDLPKADFFEQHGCLERHPGKRAVLLMGDSHSASLGVGLRAWAKTQDMDFLHASGFLDPRIYCHNMPTRQPAMACNPEYTRAVMKQLIAAKPDVLVLDMHWAMPGVLENYPDKDTWVKQIQLATRELAAELGVRKVIVVGQIPTWKGDLPTLLLEKFTKKRRPIPERTFEGIDDSSLQMEASLQKAVWPKNTQYFSLQKLLCNANGCMTRVGDDWRTDVVVWDYGHMTGAASRYVVEHGLAARITEALKR